MNNLFKGWRKFLAEEKSKIQIYCDMDGVIVNFEDGVVDYINADLKNQKRVPEQKLKKLNKMRDKLEKLGRAQEIELEDMTRNSDTNIKEVRDYMYARVSDNYEFWKDLNWRSDGQDLWNFIKDITPQVIILTAPMPGEGCRRGKIDWVKKNLGSQYNVILEEDKWKHSRTNRLLIDDTYSKIEPWAQKGGLVVHHQNSKDSINQLREILL